MIFKKIVVLIVLFGVSGVACSSGSSPALQSSPQEKMEKSVSLAKKSFLSVNTDLRSSLAFQDMVGQGASLVTWVLANVPDDAFKDYGPFVLDKPSQAWSVVLRQDSDSEVTIEGYGEDLTKPLMTETVVLNPVQ